MSSSADKKRKMESSEKSKVDRVLDDLEDVLLDPNLAAETRRKVEQSLEVRGWHRFFDSFVFLIRSSSNVSSASNFFRKRARVAQLSGARAAGPTPPPQMHGRVLRAPPTPTYKGPTLYKVDEHAPAVEEGAQNGPDQAQAMKDLKGRIDNLAATIGKARDKRTELDGNIKVMSVSLNDAEDARDAKGEELKEKKREVAILDAEHKNLAAYAAGVQEDLSDLIEQEKKVNVGELEKARLETRNLYDYFRSTHQKGVSAYECAPTAQLLSMVGWHYRSTIKQPLLFYSQLAKGIGYDDLGALLRHLDRYGFFKSAEVVERMKGRKVHTSNTTKEEMVEELGRAFGLQNDMEDPNAK